MSRSTDRIAGLEHLARLRSDLEMRRFAAYRAHVTATRARIDALGEELQALYQSEAAHTLAGARLANALAGDRSRALSRAEQDLAQMLPGFQAARSAALREFGRVQVLAALREDECRADRQEAARKAAGKGSMAFDVAAGGALDIGGST